MKAFVADIWFCGGGWSSTAGGDQPTVLFKTKLLSPRGSAPLSESVGGGARDLASEGPVLAAFGHHWLGDLRSEHCFSSLCQMGKSLFLP